MERAAAQPVQPARAAVALGLAAATVGVPGCASQGVVRYPARHILLVELRIPTDAYEFSRDCASLLSVPGVQNVEVGREVTIGGGDDALGSRWNAGAVIDLTSVRASAELRRSAAYSRLVEKWKTRAAAVDAASIGRQCDPEAPDRGTVP